MKSEIQLAFENCKKEKRPALITYTVASDPNKKKRQLTGRAIYLICYLGYYLSDFGFL